MRVCILAASTPHPVWTATYCLPSTSKEDGTAVTPEMVWNSQRILPVLPSKARNMRSLVPPENRTSPPVASTGPQLNDGRLVVHTFLPVSMFQACSSPMWSAPATIFKRFVLTPMKRSPSTYLGVSPVSSVHRFSLAGMYISRVRGLKATGGQSLPPHRLGQNSAVLSVPGFFVSSTSGRPVLGSRLLNTLCRT